MIRRQQSLPVFGMPRLPWPRIPACPLSCELCWCVTIRLGDNLVITFVNDIARSCRLQHDHRYIVFIKYRSQLSGSSDVLCRRVFEPAYCLWFSVRLGGSAKADWHFQVLIEPLRECPVALEVFRVQTFTVFQNSHSGKYSLSSTGSLIHSLDYKSYVDAGSTHIRVTHQYCLFAADVDHL